MPDIRIVVYRWLPPLAAIGLIALFVSLASWQLDRAAQKKAQSALFDDAAPFREFDASEAYRPYERVRTSGRYVSDRQVLIDNIVQGGRLGYFVITPLELSPGTPLLLVNRGWVPRPEQGTALPAIAVDGRTRRIAGRIGHLPRVALRPGQAILEGQDWPRLAVYPRQEDVAASLQRTLLPPVLLLEPQDADGYVRDWRPEEKGPMMHYGYAFQWSALAVTVLVILIVQLRRRNRRDRQS
jgi:surfeit locus 1 family protein